MCDVCKNTPANFKRKDCQHRYCDECDQKHSSLECPICTRECTNTYKGFAVICVHEKFQNSAQKQLPNALNDLQNMKTVLENYYHCTTLTYKDKDKNFYDVTLYDEIKNAMQGHKYGYFMFVLSTHGFEEIGGKPRENIQKLELSFCTYDHVYSTQRLMDTIAQIPEVMDIMKIFIIQACRSRFGQSDVENMDLGFDVPLQSPTSTNITNYDSAGSCLATANTTQLQMIDLSFPYIDDCVVVFGSMSGKYAYTYNGRGCLITHMHSSLLSLAQEKTVHILDVLTNVNFSHSSFGVPVFCDYTRKGCERYLDVLGEELKHIPADRMMQFQLLSDTVRNLKGKIKNIPPQSALPQDIVKEVQQVETDARQNNIIPNVKTQSCYFHNLVFDDDKYFCLKNV